MKRTIFCVGIFCCSFMFLSAQNIEPKSVITLKNGNILTGEILVRTEIAIVFKTEDGTRYQFPVADIERIKQQEDKQDTINTQTYTADQTDFGIMISVSGDNVFKSRDIGGAVALSGELALGMKNIAGQNWFLGAGAGYENIFEKPEYIRLLKIFFRMQKTFLSRQKISPFASLDLGYSLISNKDWTGGIFAKAKVGISMNIGSGNYLFFGLNFGVQGCNTTLGEKRNGEIYNYKGPAFLPATGISAAIMF